MKKCAVIVFPGSNCDHDMWHALRNLGFESEYVWHKTASLKDFDMTFLPGGFSYGDYLRAGAIARFSPILNAVVEFAKGGRPVLGVCNGFQILVEAGLLPGALLRNQDLRFVCRHVLLKTENNRTQFTRSLAEGQVLRIPVAHGEGRYLADEETLKELNGEGQIVFRYVDNDHSLSEAGNPNGSLENIAGIVNRRGNVLGMMPHPERAVEAVLGSTDGKYIFDSLLA